MSGLVRNAFVDVALVASRLGQELVLGTRVLFASGHSRVTDLHEPERKANTVMAWCLLTVSLRRVFADTATCGYAGWRLVVK